MRQVSLREFRTRGSKALEMVPEGGTVLLSSSQGPIYFLVPALGDISIEDKEIRRVMAKASLREAWRLAQNSGRNQMTADEINQEIEAVRSARHD